MNAGAPKFAQEFPSGAIIWEYVQPTEENVLLLNNIDMYNYTIVRMGLFLAS